MNGRQKQKYKTKRDAEMVALPELKWERLVSPFSASPSSGRFLESAISGDGQVSIPESAAILLVARVQMLISGERTTVGSVRARPPRHSVSSGCGAQCLPLNCLCGAGVAGTRGALRRSLECSVYWRGHR